jgi:hypothetical protein
VRAFYQKLKGEEFKYLHLPGVTSPIGQPSTDPHHRFSRRRKLRVRRSLSCAGSSS